MRFSTEAYCAISSRAPLSPMPGTPLMLSIVSPISARTSTTRFGGTPNFSFTPSASYPVPPQREEVLVAGHDRHLEAGGGRFLGQRADHVVGFVALGGEDRHAERLPRPVHHPGLLRELLPHPRAVRA